MAFTKITNAGFGLTTGTLVGVAASFSSTVSVGGTLTYEDVTNVDSVGLITARNGIEVTDKGVQVGTGATVDSAAANTLTFLTGGSERIRVTSDGKVGINTDMGGAPASLYPFSVYRSTGTGYVYTETAQSGASAGLRAKAGTADFTIFTTQGTGQLAVYDNTNTAERLRITSGGNVDINGTPPWTVTGGNYRNLSISGEGASASGFLWLGNGAAATNADFDLGRINFVNGANIVAQIKGTTQTSANDDGRISLLTKATGSSITEKLRIDSSGNVIIGTTTAATNAEVTIRAASPQLSLYATPGNASRITLGDTDDHNIGEISYDNSDNSLNFATNAATRMSISSNGSTTFTTNSTDTSVTDVTQLTLKNSSNAANTMAGIRFEASSNSAADHYIVQKKHGSGSGTDLIVQHGSSERIRFIESGGITFNGDTTAANALDDYEEGTFTPTAQGSTVAGTATYSQQVGKYTKIGERVFFEIYIHWSSGTGSGSALYVYGLPFTVHGGNQSYPATTIGYFHNISFASSSSPGALCASGSTYVYFYAIPNGGGSNAAIAYDSAGAMIISGHYKIN